MGIPNTSKTENVEDSNDIQVAPDRTPGKRFWVLIIPIVVAIGIALWLVPEQEKPAPGSFPEKSVATPEPRPEPAPKPKAKPEPASNPEPKPEPVPTPAPELELEPEAKLEPVVEIQARPGEQAREIIARLRKGAADGGQAAFTEAQRQHEVGRSDDAYLLYYYSAKQGHAEAALILGAQADPAYSDADTGVLDHADPQQAYKWYRMAADNGSTEAERRLDALFENVKKSAAAGDEQAGRLMLQWRERE